MIIGLLLIAALPILAAEQLWFPDLEASSGELISNGQTGQWEWGKVSSGPKASYDGSSCWATQLDGWYLNDAEDHLELPALPLDGTSRPVLALQQWYSFAEGDLGTVQALQGGSWVELEPVYGYPTEGGYQGESEGWEPAWFNLSGLVQGETLRFTITADAAGADLGWYLDELALWDGDVVPPKVELDACLADTDDLEGPYVVRADVRDDVTVNAVTLVYQVDHGTVHRRAMSLEGDSDTWETDLPGQAAGSVVSYHVEADDNENITTVPAEDCSFEVRLPSPTGLQGPTGVVWGTVVPLSWNPPDSTHDVYAYQVYRDEEIVLEVTEPQAEAEVLTGEQDFSVSAMYEAGEGAQSDAVTIQAAVPAVLGLSPDLGYQSDHLRLRLEGEYLLLEQGDLQIDLGEGLRITEYDVRDVDLAFVEIFVAANAPDGPRDLTLSTGGLELVVVDAFEVLPGSDRPTLTGLEPDTVRQGDELELVITASEPFADVPTVWLGQDIVVQDVSLDQDDTLTASVIVPYHTPLGLHDLEVDDGVRIFGGPQLQVRDYLAPVDPDGTCSSVPARTGLPWLLLALCVALCSSRRRAIPRCSAGGLRRPGCWCRAHRLLRVTPRTR